MQFPFVILSAIYFHCEEESINVIRVAVPGWWTLCAVAMSTTTSTSNCSRVHPAKLVSLCNSNRFIETAREIPIMNGVLFVNDEEVACRKMRTQPKQTSFNLFSLFLLRAWTIEYVSYLEISIEFNYVCRNCSKFVSFRCAFNGMKTNTRNDSFHILQIFIHMELKCVVAFPNSFHLWVVVVEHNLLYAYPRECAQLHCAFAENEWMIRTTTTDFILRSSARIKSSSIVLICTFRKNRVVDPDI